MIDDLRKEGRSRPRRRRTAGWRTLAVAGAVAAVVALGVLLVIGHPLYLFRSSIAETLGNTRGVNLATAYLGIAVQDIKPSLAQTLQLKSKSAGVAVVRVIAGSPAAKSGVRPGDVLLQFGNVRVSSVVDLQSAIGRASPGQTVRMVVDRLGQRVTTFVELAEVPATMVKPTLAAQESTRSDGDYVVAPLTAELAKKLSLPPSTKGVVVVSVAEKGAAQAAGLKAGDVIVAVNKEEIEDLAGFYQALGDSQSVSLQVRRGAQTLYVQYDARAVAPPVATIAGTLTSQTVPQRVAIASTGTDLSSQLALRFGTAPYFLIADFPTNRFVVVKNNINTDTRGYGVTAAQLVASQGVGATVAAVYGAQAYGTLKLLKIEPYVSKVGAVSDVLAQYRANLLSVATDTTLSGFGYARNILPSGGENSGRTTAGTSSQRADYCYCPICGKLVPHPPSVSCADLSCPTCGTRLRNWDSGSVAPTPSNSASAPNTTGRVQGSGTLAQQTQYCFCPVCKTLYPRPAGVPCSTLTCSACKSQLISVNSGVAATTPVKTAATQPPTTGTQQPSTQGQSPSGTARAPSTGQGQAPSTGQGQAPSTGQGQAPSTGQGQAPAGSSATNQAQNPMGTGRAPGSTQTQTPGSSQTQTPAGSSSSNQPQNPIGAGRQPTANQNPSSVGAGRQQPITNQSQSSTGAGRQPSGMGARPVGGKPDNIPPGTATAGQPATVPQSGKSTPSQQPTKFPAQGTATGGKPDNIPPGGSSGGTSRGGTPTAGVRVGGKPDTIPPSGQSGGGTPTTGVRVGGKPDNIPPGTTTAGPSSIPPGGPTTTTRQSSSSSGKSTAGMPTAGTVPLGSGVTVVRSGVLPATLRQTAGTATNPTGVLQGTSDGFCVCPKCGTKVPHVRGTACYTLTCPKCHTPMVRDTLLSPLLKTSSSPVTISGDNDTAGRICIATTGPTMEAKVAPLFDRAPYFLIVGLGTCKVIANPNVDDKTGVGVQSAQLVVGEGAAAVITNDISIKALQELSRLRIKTFTGINGTATQALGWYQNGRLTPTLLNSDGNHEGSSDHGSSGSSGGKGRDSKSSSSTTTTKKL